MKLEKQVCSFELANKLRALGVKQESEFQWWATDVEEDGLTWWILASKQPRRGKRVRALSTNEHYRGPVAAFTVAELGEILPKWTSSWCDVEDYEQSGVKHGRTYVCGREHEMREKGEEFAVDATEADARAKMLIYLLENDLRKPAGEGTERRHS